MQYYQIFATNFEKTYFAEHILVAIFEACMILNLLSKFGKLEPGDTYKLYSCKKEVFTLKEENVAGRKCH